MVRYRRLQIGVAVVVLIALLSNFAAATDDANDKYGVTGTFGGSVFVVPRGGSVEASGRSVVVVNDSDQTQSFVLSQETPDGIEFTYPDSPISVKPHDAKSIPIGVRVDRHVAPGEYVGWMIVSQVETAGDKQASGTRISRRVKQPARIKVAGEPGYVTVEPRGPDGKVVDVPVRAFYREDDGGQVEVGRGHGVTKWAVAPGTIRVVAEVDGRILDEETVRVKPGDKTIVRLSVNGAVFESVYLTPQYRWWFLPKIESVRIDYSVRAYVDYKDIRSEIVVKNQDGEVIHQETMHEWPEVPKGLHQEAYVYEPGDELRPGRYLVELRLYQGNTILALGAPILLTVFDFSFLLLLLLLLVLLMVVYLLWKKHRQTKRHKKERAELLRNLQEQLRGDNGNGETGR